MIQILDYESWNVIHIFHLYKISNDDKIEYGGKGWIMGIVKSEDFVFDVVARFKDSTSSGINVAKEFNKLIKIVL